MSEDVQNALRDVVGFARVSGVERLTGGASRETWRFDADGSRYIVQSQRTGSPRDMHVEIEVLEAAHRLGVPVAEVVADSRGTSGHPVLGDRFMIVRAVEGETIARKILRDERFAAARRVLPAQIGTAMAQLHRIDHTSIAGLEPDDQVTKYRQLLDESGQHHPAFEIAFRWLESNRPAPNPACLVHGDFRLGNLIVGDDGLRAVLDWELAHIGDPAEDLGWVCVRAWRFGASRPVAGVGEYVELLDAYAHESGRRIPEADLRWWELLGTVKWGLMCISQAAYHLNGTKRSHELAAIGRRVCENEYDALMIIRELIAGAVAK